MGLDTQGLQIDDQRPTGRVTVEFVDGEPSYDIVRPSAWDAIEANRINNGCSMLYHGTLALRDQASLTALEAIRSNTEGPVLVADYTFPATGHSVLYTGARPVFVDVNLRSPWWDRDSVLSLLIPANWVKLNSDELALLNPSGQSDSDAALQFIESHRLDGLILTHGGEGAEILTAGGEHVSARPEARIAIVDTVGAGDAFASVILLGLSEGWPLRQMLERAQSFASRIVGRRGATVGDPDFYGPFIESWHLHY